MPTERPAFTIGIEEEYLLVDPESRDLLRDPPDSLMKQCEEVLGPQVGHEFLKAQVEVGTKVSNTVAEARQDLVMLRRGLRDVAERNGIAYIAASTHPFADWAEQQITDKTRYQMLAKDLQAVARRLVICGMHVHVGIEDPEVRLDLMNQVTYFLPHLLALSSSSPFWHGVETGLKSYRMSVFYSLPRTGPPERFSSWSEYERHVAALVDAGLIEDATRLWWDIRPSARYPTIEMRIADISTRVDDGITVAALFLSLLGMLFRRRLDNQRWRSYSNMLVSENTWRAQRYGVEGSLADFGKGTLIPFADLMEEAVELVRPDAEAFGCVAEVARIRDLARDGTSADRQLAAFRAAIDAGASDEEALRKVVDHLISDTLVGLDD
jgi:carboxylate-amine ligase